jgi:hypothetical protein
MTLRASLIEKEIDNRINVLTWADFMAAVNALTTAEQNAVVAALSSNSGSVRQIILKQIKQTVRQTVANDVDAFIASGSVPVSFLRKVLE